MSEKQNKMDEETNSTNHKTVINVDNNDGIQEEIFSKKNMQYDPHICDHHKHEIPNKFKSELNISPIKINTNTSNNDADILKNIQNQIETNNSTNTTQKNEKYTNGIHKKDETDYSLTLEIKSPLQSEIKSDPHLHQPPISTITVQNRQGSELNNSCKINYPASPTSTGAFFASELSDPQRRLSDPNRKLSDPSRKLSDPSRKLSDPSRKLSDPSRKLSDPSRKLSDPNRKLSDSSNILSDLSRKLSIQSDQQNNSSNPIEIKINNGQNIKESILKPASPTGSLPLGSVLTEKVVRFEDNTKSSDQVKSDQDKSDLNNSTGPKRNSIGNSDIVESQNQLNQANGKFGNNLNEVHHEDKSESVVSDQNISSENIVSNTDVSINQTLLNQTQIMDKDGTNIKLDTDPKDIKNLIDSTTNISNEKIDLNLKSLDMEVELNQLKMTEIDLGHSIPNMAHKQNTDFDTDSSQIKSSSSTPLVRHVLTQTSLEPLPITPSSSPVHSTSSSDYTSPQPIHPISPLVHPTSPLVHPTSPLVHPTSPLAHPSSSQPIHPTSSSVHPTLSSVHLTSSVVHPSSKFIHSSSSPVLRTSPFVHPISPLVHPTSSLIHPISPLVNPSSPLAHPSTQAIHPTSSPVHPTSSSIHPTSSNLHPSSQDIHPTSSSIHPITSPGHLSSSHPALSPSIPSPLVSSSLSNITTSNSTTSNSTTSNSSPSNSSPSNSSPSNTTTSNSSLSNSMTSKTTTSNNSTSNTTASITPTPPTPSTKSATSNGSSLKIDELSLRSRVGCAETGVLRSPVPPQMSSMEEENLRDRIHAKLLKECGEVIHQEPRYTKDAFKRLMQNKEFLDQLFKLFDQDRDNLLHQDHWIEFLKERLSDERHIDFAEQIESVAYVLCGEGPITPDLFYQIFHAKGIVDKLFRLVDQDNVGSISSEQVMEFVSNITNTRPRTGFDKKSLEALEQLFRQTVGNEKEIRREDFQKIVISKNPFFTERVFQIFDKDNSGSISLQEFLDSMHQFAGQSPDDKIKFLFKIYDIDGDGLIQHRELQHVLRACMEENGMQFSEDQISDLTAAMFEDADCAQRGAITYEALKHQLEKHGGLLENLSISIDRWLVPPKPKAKPRSLWGKMKALRPYQLTRPYLKNNYVYLVFLVGFVAVNVGLFVSRAVEYGRKGSNGYVIVARACGQCLNFNCMFVLVLMLRQCITFLRTRGWSSVLPLDHHIYLHKLTGTFIAALSLLHTVMHLLNFGVVVVNHPEMNSNNYTLTEWLFTSRPGQFGLMPGLANPTGMSLFIILLIMFVCSQAFVRRGGSFEIFYWTHLLYVPFWLLLIFHGPNFWKWFIIPGVIYLMERVLRLVWMKSERGKTYISSGLLLPSKVTHLVIKRPLHFDFHPGDYVFVNIPAIAKYEWHPFTISSAPEQEDYMWLHIRAVGEWTNRLYNYFEREQEKLHNGEIPPLLSGGQTEKKAQQPMMSNDSNTLRRLQASLKRKFSNRDPNRNKDGAQLVRYSHDRFAVDTVPQVSASEGEIHNRASCSNEALNYPAIPKSLSPEKRLQMLLFHQKVPLEKSLSMPDIQTKAKKRERLLVLREYMRSESERSFDECQVRRARLQSLGLAYLSPQNKSLAQSFRYLRHKPTIIAFKTPSLEQCDQRTSFSSLGSVGRQTSAGSFVGSPERQVEEGRAASSTEVSPKSPASPVLKPVNYPVGKPLEPIPEDRSLLEIEDLESLISYGILGRGTEIYLDGPYGAPSSHIFRAQHAVLIATGIGVTPFASILQSIMHRYWKARHACPRCLYSWASEIPAAVMHLRKVDFFWINRDQRSFEWFVHLLSQLEMEQAELGAAMERFLEMHMYITSALQKTDMKAVGLQLALDLLHEKEKRDLITGLKTRTNAGRPNWDKVFKQLQDQRKGKVTVFYCGPPQLARLLRYKCDQHGFSFRKETF